MKFPTNFDVFVLEETNAGIETDLVEAVGEINGNNIYTVVNQKIVVKSEKSSMLTLDQLDKGTVD